MITKIIFLSLLLHLSHSFSVVRTSTVQNYKCLEFKKYWGSSSSYQLNVQSDDDEEIFEAEEAAAYDAIHVPDSGMEAAVMERAVMMAYDMMKKKKKEFKQKVLDARAAEQQYVMMEQATQDLVKQYNEDPTKFKEHHATKSGGQVAIEMLESVIADAAKKMIDIENSQNLVISQFHELLEEEHMAEARAAKESLQERAADNRVIFIEEFNDTYEVDERRRDMAVSHAAHEAAEAQEELVKSLSESKEHLMNKEERMKKQLLEHKRNEEILKADLREIQEIVREELLKEWEAQREQQQEQEEVI